MDELDVSRTPAVTIYAAFSEEVFEARVAELYAQIDKSESVQAARETFEKATAKRQRLSDSQARLNNHVVALDAKLAKAAEDLRAALLDGADASPALLQQHGSIATERGGAVQAIGLLVEGLIPESEVEKMLAESAYLYAKSAAIKALVDERGRHLVELLSQAVDAEGVITVDFLPPTIETSEGIVSFHRPSTITGLLIVSARNLSLKASKFSDEARKHAEQHKDRLSKKERSH